MGNKSSLLLREEEILQIQEETGCKCNNWTLFDCDLQIFHIFFNFPRKKRKLYDNLECFAKTHNSFGT